MKELACLLKVLSYKVFIHLELNSCLLCSRSSFVLIFNIDCNAGEITKGVDNIIICITPCRIRLIQHFVC